MQDSIGLLEKPRSEIRKESGKATAPHVNRWIALTQEQVKDLRRIAMEKDMPPGNEGRILSEALGGAGAANPSFAPPREDTGKTLVGVLLPLSVDNELANAAKEAKVHVADIIGDRITQYINSQKQK